MLAAVTEDVGRMALRDRPEPRGPGRGEVALRPEAVGICGSDFHFFSGELSEQAGGSQFPRVQGHELAGTIVALGADCRPELRVGQRVAVWPLRACGECYPCRAGRPNTCDRFRLIGIHLDGGLQELLLTGQEQVFAVTTDDPAVAAMAEPVSIAVRAVNRARVTAGERMLVLGAGPIGQSVCLVALERGAEVMVIDPQEHRLEMSRWLGATTAPWFTIGQAVRAARRWAAPAGPPVVIEASGAPAAVRAMVEAVSSAGRAVQVGMSGEEVWLRIGNFTEKELDLLGVSCCQAEEFAQAVEIVERNAPVLEQIISHRFPLRRAAEALQFAIEHQSDVMKVVIDGV